MPGSKYDRELRFIATEVNRLSMQLREMRDTVPANPAEAAMKAEKVIAIEEKIAQLLARKKEIEDSFIAAGMEMPDIERDLNTNVHEDTRNFTDTPATRQEPVVRPAADEAELTQEIESVTDELMGLEIKMLRADMNGDDAEKEKLSMMASSLRSRRDSLVEAVKQMRAEAEAAEAQNNETCSPSDSETARRLDNLESENRALRSQISDLRTDITDVKDSLRQIVRALGLDD